MQTVIVGVGVGDGDRGYRDIGMTYMFRLFCEEQILSYIVIYN